MIYGDHAMPTIDFREPLRRDPRRPGEAQGAAQTGWTAAGCASTWEVATGQQRNGPVQRGLFCALFSLAVGLRSYPKLIRDMRRDPAFAHDLFTCLVDEVLPSYLKARATIPGVNLESARDAWAAYPNLTPELIEEWVVPYPNRLLGNTMQLGFAAHADARAAITARRT